MRKNIQDHYIDKQVNIAFLKLVGAGQALARPANTKKPYFLSTGLHPIRV